MDKNSTTTGLTALAPRSTWRFRARQWLTLARKKPVGTASLVVMLIMAFAGIFAPFVGTVDLSLKDDYNSFAAPSATHWFGTDEFGRDFYSQMVYGARITFMVAFVSIGLGGVVGLAVGVVSGYFGGRVDMLMQRLVDIMLSFPSLVLALTIMAALGRGLDKVIIAIAIVEGPRMARIVRGNVLSVKENMYVDAARSIGAGPLRIIVVHVVPGIMAVFVVYATLLLGAAVLLEASLSYLGMGVPPPEPSWGRFLSGSAVNYAFAAPHLMIVPGVSITLLVLAFNLFGDVLRDIWDPRLRGT